MPALGTSIFLSAKWGWRRFNQMMIPKALAAVTLGAEAGNSGSLEEEGGGFYFPAPCPLLFTPIPIGHGPLFLSREVGKDVPTLRSFAGRPVGGGVLQDGIPDRKSVV